MEHGVWVPPSRFEAWFLSTALTEDQIDQTLEAMEKAFEQLK